VPTWRAEEDAVARLGMTIPLQTVPLLEHERFVKELEQLGYTDVWTSEAQDLDGFIPLALASQWAKTLRLGCACFPVQTRGPAVFAMSAAAMALAASGRFVLGIGSSSEFSEAPERPVLRQPSRTRTTWRDSARGAAARKVRHGTR
jgi:alkanesulfonate monooxygenase SsuD/methylene tetrahydromethanopterin reductase-like flavin-dependent oxidoreductase (luciferase family)